MGCRYIAQPYDLINEGSSEDILCDVFDVTRTCIADYNIFDAQLICLICLTNDEVGAMILSIMLENACFFSFYFYFAQPPKPPRAEEDCLP